MSEDSFLTIKLQDAMRWLCRMAGADGVVSARLVPGRMIGYEKTITKEGYFQKCRCQPTSEEFHKYVNHYFNSRVFRLPQN